jgi:single-strand DNA-binding protein
MAGFNKIILIGHLTRNPELRYTPNGTPVATVGFATNRRFKQGDELKEEVLFIDVVAFGKQAENAAKYLAKGSKVTIDGRLQQRRWETDAGEKRSKHEVVAEQIVYLDKAKGQDDSAPEAGVTMGWEQRES